jgi:uncharacterized protein YdeI (YjbR/CyaY-like superfamily)
VDLDHGIEIPTVERFREWMATASADAAELWAVIFKKASGKQTVTFDELLEEALCWGWVDVQTKSVDGERYGIRFVRRRPGSNWSATNRRIVCRLLREKRLTPAGQVLLPPDLTCPES